MPSAENGLTKLFPCRTLMYMSSYCLLDKDYCQSGVLQTALWLANYANKGNVNTREDFSPFLNAVKFKVKKIFTYSNVEFS